MSPKILVLSYWDNPAEGHGFSLHKHLLECGCDSYFLSYVSEYTHENPHYFVDTRSWWDKFCFHLKKKLHPAYKRLPNKEEYALLNPKFCYIGNAKSILKKIGIKPDIIVFTWCDYFISPKVIYDLYKKTGAKIVISLTDAHFIGGGCHFPCDCTQYETGCQQCPVLKDSKPTRQLYNEKVRYLSNMPMKLVGSSYDLMRARKTKFFQEKEMKPIIIVPEIPMNMKQVEARKHFGFADNVFVIMCGGASLRDKRKGFSLFLAALRKFAKSINENRQVVLLLLGKGQIELTNNFNNQEISVVQPGFLDMKELFMAFYASDLFASTSIDDSGPVMVNYSIACGTPVLSFPVGAAQDLVKDEETGYMAKFLDVDDLARGIEKFYFMDKREYQRYSENCRFLMEKLKKNITPWYLSVLE